MATGVILAGGTSRRMPGDKAFMEISGRRVIDIELDVMEGLFEEILIIGNTERVEILSLYERDGVKILEETVRGKGAIGGLLSGLQLSGSSEVFITACDMPFMNRRAVKYIVGSLPGYMAAVPSTPEGLEPLHAAYSKECASIIADQLEHGDLKISDLFNSVPVNYIPMKALRDFDPSGRLLFNINSPVDMRKAAGEPEIK
ncbi:MAG: molybdenum cofactor guanylyltransferase [Actinobacteria bacterium]|nr:molybdenum cofactor guanylyltransferase [Actinomycetota bacterium]